MTKCVTLTFTREELADALCHTNLTADWYERADEVIEILSAADSTNDGPRTEPCYCGTPLNPDQITCGANACNTAARQDRAGLL